MSLIHDALKKAQEQAKAQIGSGLVSFQGPEVEKKPPVNKRTMFLAGALVIVVAFFVYTKFMAAKKSGAPAAMLPSTAVQSADIGAQDAGKLKKKAIEAYAADDFETAWASLSAAIQLDDKDPELWNNFGLVARKRGDAGKARNSYEKALDLKPDYPEAMNNLAVLEMQAGNSAAARELLEKALGILPAYPEANLNLAILYDQSGEKQKAMEYYKRFLQVGKNFPSITVDSVRDRVVEMEP